MTKNITLKHYTMKNFHNTLTKWTVLLLGGAVIFACTDLSGIEERVDSLDSRITALETQIESLNKNISTITALVNESTFITKVDRTENGFTITMSDSEVYTIENGKTGDTPVITIDEDGYWMAQYGDNEPQYITVDGTADGEKILATATAPLFRVSADGYWEVSTNGGESYSTVYLEDGTTPAQAIGQPGEPGEQGDSFFKDVSYNEEDGILSLTLADGKTYSFTVTSDFACEIESVTYAEAEIFQPGTSREFKVIYKGIDDVYLTVPQGWSATLEGEESPAILTVTPPAAKTKISADSQSDVVVHAVSGDRSIFAKMKVELFDGAIPAATVTAGEVSAKEVNFTVTPNADVTSWKYMLLAASETAPAVPEDFDTRATEIQGNAETPLKLDKDASGTALATGTEYVLYVLAIATEEDVPTYAADIASASATPAYGTYYEMWLAGESITIAGKTYTTEELTAKFGEAIHITSENVASTTVGTTKALYFIDSDVTATPSSGGACNSVMIIGNSISERSHITIPSGGRYFALNNADGAFVCMNIDFDASAYNNYMITSNYNGNFAYIAFDNCHFKLYNNRPVINLSTNNGTSRGVETFIMEDCTYETHAGTDNRYILNMAAATGETNTATIENMTFRNNIFYCNETGSIAQNVKLLNGQNNTVTNVVIENNSFINVNTNTTNNITFTVYAKAIGNLTFRNNLFKAESIAANNGFIRSNEITGGTVQHNASYVANPNGFKVTIFHGNAASLDGAEELRILDSDPFAGGEFDIKNEIFVPAPEYSSYGAQRN